MSGRVLGRVLPLAEFEVGWLREDVRTAHPRALAMSICIGRHSIDEVLADHAE
jgi:hypothetical protein